MAMFGPSTLASGSAQLRHDGLLVAWTHDDSRNPWRDPNGLIELGSVGPQERTYIVGVAENGNEYIHNTQQYFLCCGLTVAIA